MLLEIAPRVTKVELCFGREHTPLTTSTWMRRRNAEHSFLQEDAFPLAPRRNDSGEKPRRKMRRLGVRHASSRLRCRRSPAWRAEEKSAVSHAHRKHPDGGPARKVFEMRRSAKPCPWGAPARAIDGGEGQAEEILLGRKMTGRRQAAEQRGAGSSLATKVEKLHSRWNAEGLIAAPFTPLGVIISNEDINFYYFIGSLGDWILLKYCMV